MNESTRNEYIQNLRTNIYRFENIVNNRNHTTEEAINDLLIQFSDTQLNIAEPFCESVTDIRQGGSRFKRRKDSPWFDAECKTAKRTWTNADLIVWHYPESINEEIFYLYFEQRLSNCFHQNLRVEFENAHTLRLYKYLNLPMHPADYLNYIFMINIGKST